MYKNLFFDLDHTLWDFEKNSRESLTVIFNEFISIHHPEFSCEEFIDAYEIANERLWAEYGDGRIVKAELRFRRFSEALQKLGVKKGVDINTIDNFYVENTPKRRNLFPKAKETLETLLDCGFVLHLITNGFNESQLVKINGSGLDEFFETVTTAESAGFWKPDVRIFHSAMSKRNSRAEESLMVGDHLDRDIRGANRAGITSVWFNPRKIVNKTDITPKFEIEELQQIIDIVKQ